MSNVYLEKIALSVEDVRSARKEGEKAFKKTDAKGTAIGAGVGASGGAVYGATRMYNKAVRSGEAAKMARGIPGATPRKIRAGMAAGSAIVGLLGGAVAGSTIAQVPAQNNQLKTQTKHLNKALLKQAAITQRQVEKRNDSNSTTKDLYAAGGSFAGAGAGVGAALGYSAVRAGALGNLKQSAKNALNGRGRSGKPLAPATVTNADGAVHRAKATLVGKEGGVVPFVDKAGVARKAGRLFGKAGVAGLIGGSILGSAWGANKANKKNDAADAKYYAKIDARNKADFASKGK